MMKLSVYTVLLIVILAITACENYDKAKQGIQKGVEFVGNAEKKVAETREGAEKSIGKILGKETAKSNDKKSDDDKSDRQKSREEKSDDKDHKHREKKD